MTDRKRGENFPYIENFNLSEKETSIIQENSFEESENIEVRAYCLDLKQKRAKDKRQPQIDASLSYLNLYEVFASCFVTSAYGLKGRKVMSRILEDS